MEEWTHFLGARMAMGNITVSEHFSLFNAHRKIRLPLRCSLQEIVEIKSDPRRWTSRGEHGLGLEWSHWDWSSFDFLCTDMTYYYVACVAYVAVFIDLGVRSTPQLKKPKAWSHHPTDLLSINSQGFLGTAFQTSAETSRARHGARRRPSYQGGLLGWLGPGWGGFRLDDQHESHLSRANLLPGGLNLDPFRLKLGDFPDTKKGTESIRVDLQWCLYNVAAGQTWVRKNDHHLFIFVHGMFVTHSQPQLFQAISFTLEQDNVRRWVGDLLASVCIPPLTDNTHLLEATSWGHDVQGRSTNLIRHRKTTVRFSRPMWFSGPVHHISSIFGDVRPILQMFPALSGVGKCPN